MKIAVDIKFVNYGGICFCRKECPLMRDDKTKATCGYYGDLSIVRIPAHDNNGKIITFYDSVRFDNYAIRPKACFDAELPSANEIKTEYNLKG